MTHITLSDPSAAAGVDPALVAFIYHEARLADEARYSEWEALWDDSARYWVPMSWPWRIPWVGLCDSQNALSSCW